MSRATRAPSGPSILALEKAAGEAHSLVLKMKIDEVGLEVHSNPSWGSIYGWARGGKLPGDIEKGASLGAVMRALAAKVPRPATLDPGAVTCEAVKSPLKHSSLLDLSIAAWHEAFGLNPPSLEELAARRKAERVAARARQASEQQKRKELLQLLASGPDGTKRWTRRLSQAKKLAPFNGVDLSGANLSGVTLLAMPEGRFVGAQLASANLGCQDFSKASFQKAVLREAKLAGATLRQADFTGADLEGADLTHALIEGAVFTDASLASVRLADARFDATTVWPAGFALPEDLCWTGQGPNPAALAALEARRKSEGPVDLKSFMARLEKTIEKPRMAKAVSMLKSERFQLFVEVDDARLAGIVKSQTDPSLVYSCSLGLDGRFGCCTQNLNVCGGLRGALCKHLLVLVIGIAQSGQLDADTLDEWVQKSALHKPVLDREMTSAVLLRYKGAEAGEIDWRPTETVPEDFYAF